MKLMSWLYNNSIYSILSSSWPGAGHDAVRRWDEALFSETYEKSVTVDMYNLNIIIKYNNNNHEMRFNRTLKYKKWTVH